MNQETVSCHELNGQQARALTSLESGLCLRRIESTDGNMLLLNWSSRALVARVAPGIPTRSSLAAHCPRTRVSLPRLAVFWSASAPSKKRLLVKSMVYKEEIIPTGHHPSWNKSIALTEDEL